MRAVWLREFGGPDVLTIEETPDPTPGPGQVLVDVVHVNITFVDTQIRAGKAPFPVEIPKIPGNGVGGVVLAVGAGVDPSLTGSRVVGSTGGSGGYAEQALVAVDDLFAVPESLEPADAVALLADGRTASMLAAAIDLKRGDRVLVEAAAGGVGSLLVQLAHAAGATVVAAAGGRKKLALALDLGADFGVDYREADWPDQARAAVGGLDAVFDGVGGDIGRAAYELLGSGGRMLAFGLASGSWSSIPPEEAAARGVKLVKAHATPEEMRGFTESALLAAAEGRLRPVIGQRFALGRVSEAHAAIQARETVGKTLLETGKSTPSPDPMDELVYEVDDADDVVRTVRRGELTDKALRHRSVGILFRDAEGRILVHRRAKAKRVFPQHYDMFVAGMVPAGEEYDVAARREAAEEIGALDVELTAVGKFRFDDDAVPQWTMMYEAVVTGPVVPQVSEVEWFTFLTPAEVERSLDEWPYCPDSKAFYQSIYLGIPQTSIIR